MALLIGAYVTPALIRHRQQIMHTPVEDRFSDQLRLLHDNINTPRVSAERGKNRPRLVDSQVVWRTASPDPTTGPSHEVEGEEDMAQNKSHTAGTETERHPQPAHRQTHTDISVPAASRELARLRARRAARIAAEKASAQRRYVTILTCLATLVGLAIAAYNGTLSPWWMTAPTLAVAGTFAWGHVAYRQSTAASQREVEQLKRLRDLRNADQRRSRRLRTNLFGQNTETETASSTRTGEDNNRANAATNRAANTTNNDNTEHSTPTTATPTTTATNAANEDIDVVEAAIATGWALHPLPAPTYANQPSLPRRQVINSEADNAEEPATVRRYSRPLTASPTPLQAQSSSEAAQDAPVAFDLEEVLEARRAQ